MAKKKGKKSQARPAPKPAGAPAAPLSIAKKPKIVSLPPEQPAFWFGFDVAWAKLFAFRLVFFGLLALDALLQLRHAPRYGASGFNVAQLPLLDGFGPARVTYAFAQLACSYLFVL